MKAILAGVAVMVVATVALADTSAPEEEINNGQDFTRPLTRVDIRYQYQNLPPDSNDNTHVFTLRADKPFVLGRGWMLATRADLPFTLTDAPNGTHNFGLSDALVQGLLIHALDQRWAVAGGTQIVFPSATSQETGGGQWRIVPTAAVRASLPELGKGVWIAGLIRYDTDFAGDSDRPGRQDLVLQPIINIPLGDGRWFLNFLPEIRYNFDDARPGDKGRWFVPFETLLGYVWPGKAVASLQISTPIIDDYQQYDFKTELRLGFFF